MKQCIGKMAKLTLEQKLHHAAQERRRYATKRLKELRTHFQDLPADILMRTSLRQMSGITKRCGSNGLQTSLGPGAFKQGKIPSESLSKDSQTCRTATRTFLAAAVVPSAA